MELKKSVKAQAIKITSGYEGEGYTSLAGNFDNHYMSYGFLQWNLGSGTLQPLFNKLFRDYPTVASKILPNGGIDLKNALANKKEIAWALSIQNNNVVQNPWKDALVSLGNTPEMMSIQDSSAIEYINQAINLCNKYKLTTDRAYCLMFDIAVQNWGPTSSFIMPLGISYLDKLKAIVDNVVAKSDARWRDVVRDRKMAIVNGSGLVYGGPVSYTFYDSSMYYDESMRISLNTLVSGGVTSSPDYWMEYADGKIPCRGDYMGDLILNYTRATSLRDGVNILFTKGIIKDTNYWIANAITGKTVLGVYAKNVINGIAKVKI